MQRPAEDPLVDDAGELDRRRARTVAVADGVDGRGSRHRRLSCARRGSAGRRCRRSPTRSAPTLLGEYDQTLASIPDGPAKVLGVTAGAWRRRRCWRSATATAVTVCWLHDWHGARRVAAHPHGERQRPELVGLGGRAVHAVVDIAVPDAGPRNLTWRRTTTGVRRGQEPRGGDGQRGGNPAQAAIAQTSTSTRCVLPQPHVPDHLPDGGPQPRGGREVVRDAPTSR